MSLFKCCRMICVQRLCLASSIVNWTLTDVGFFLSDFALIWCSYSAIFTLLIFAHLLPSPDHNFLMLLWGCWVVCPHLYRKGICNLEIIINSNVWNLYIWYTFVISNFIKRLIIISHYPRPVSVFNYGKQSSDLYSPPFLGFFHLFWSSRGKA